MWVLLVGSKDHADDVDFVAESFGEARTKWSVDQSCSQRRGVAGASFTTEERTRDLAGGVGALFDVDSEWKEIRTFTDTTVLPIFATTAPSACQASWPVSNVRVRSVPAIGPVTVMASAMSLLSDCGVRYVPVPSGRTLDRIEDPATGSWRLRALISARHALRRALCQTEGSSDCLVAAFWQQYC